MSSQLNDFDVCKEKLTPLQKSIHLPGDPKLGINNQHNKIHTPFHYNLSKSTWSHHFTEKLQSSLDELTSKMTFRVNIKYHGLCYVDLEQELPEIILQEGYEGKWTDNLGSNIVKKAQLFLDTNLLQTLDQEYNDCYSECMIEDKKSYNEDIGNNELLQTWQKEIKASSTSFTMPWFFTDKISKTFPLFFCGYLNDLRFHLELRRTINELFLIRKINDDGTYTENIDFNSESVLKVGNKISGLSITPELLLSPPTMYGEYVLKSDLECNHNRCEAVNQLSNVFLIEDIISIDPEEILKSGDKYIKDLKDLNRVIHTYMWMLKNINNEKKYSNYISDTNINPVLKTTINTGNITLVDNLLSYRTNKKHPEKHFPSVPKTGYNVWTCGMKAKDTYPIPGHNISNGKIEITLNNDKISTNYLLKLRLISYKKLTFTNFPDTEEKRKISQALITISEM